MLNNGKVVPCPDMHVKDWVTKGYGRIFTHADQIALLTKEAADQKAKEKVEIAQKVRQAKAKVKAELSGKAAEKAKLKTQSEAIAIAEEEAKAEFEAEAKAALDAKNKAAKKAEAIAIAEAEIEAEDKTMTEEESELIEARKLYEQVLNVPVPNNKKNDVEWLREKAKLGIL